MQFLQLVLLLVLSLLAQEIQPFAGGYSNALLNTPRDKALLRSYFELEAKKAGKRPSKNEGQLEDLLDEEERRQAGSRSLYNVGDGTDQMQFPQLDQAGAEEKALRASPFGKALFGVLDKLFPVFKEPNW
jgi:hypothetical protein